MKVILSSSKGIKLLVIVASLLMYSCSSDESEAIQEIEPIQEAEPTQEAEPIQEDEKNNPDTEDPPIEIVNTEKKAAITLYNDYYLASELESNEITWINGDVLNCQAGSVPTKVLDKILNRLLYFRKASGLNNSITINSEKNQKAQVAALIMKVNQSLSHDIDSTWECYSEEGKAGAKNSNLYYYSINSNLNAVNAIDGYIKDPGTSNFGVGHRRWLLWPKLYDIGIGSTDQSNALWVVGDAGPRTTDALQFIAWPPSGYIPSELAFERWSFSLNDADFSQATVTMTNDQGENISLKLEELSEKSTDSTIVWIPENISTDSNDDVTYKVKLENVILSNESKDFEYDVILFDKNS